MVQVQDLGDQPKDLRDSSYYVTRILNSLMSDLSLMKHRAKDRNFNMTSLLTKEEHTELCQLVAIIVERCVQHKQLSSNIKEFTEKNGYDFYYRFLCYLFQKSEFLAFNRLCLALVKLLSTTSYLLPDMYRTLSLCLLQSLSKSDPSIGKHKQPTSAQSPSIFCLLSLCRVNKFFFYDSSHKKLFSDVLEQCFVKKAPSFSCTLTSVLQKADKRLTKLAAKGRILFGASEEELASDAEPDRDERASIDDEVDDDKGSKSKKSGGKKVRTVDDDEIGSKKKAKKSKKDDDDEDDKVSKKAGKKLKMDSKKKDEDDDDDNDKKAIAKSKDKKKKDDAVSKDDKGKSKDKKTKDDKGKSKDKKYKDDKVDKAKSKDKKTKDDKAKSKDKKDDKNKKDKKTSPSKKKKVDPEEGANVGAYPADSDDEEAEEEVPEDEEGIEKASMGIHRL